MYLAYNTNGLAHHRLEDAFHLLADLGYRGVALTPDVGHLDPFTTHERDWEKARGLLDRLKLQCVIETGARYILDARRKHWPNLVSKDDAAAERRLGFYLRCLRMAKILGSELISIWSGPMEAGDDRDAAVERLVPRLVRLLDDARETGVHVCFEPEPGHVVDSHARYRELRRRLKRDDLMTTIDVGHLLVTEPGEPHEHLAEFAPSLRNIQVDDARRGVHEHLMPGAGEIDFVPVFAELRRLGYTGSVALELSRDSHRAADAAADAFRILSPMLK
ncbi:MAG TPA: sugar phosphate isomerase/epimerase family protein [Planctomycetota bacterium]|nr:sugar phosphate isomerase/epimerase family protein [Planctomycetota bacterium]